MVSIYSNLEYDKDQNQNIIAKLVLFVKERGTIAFKALMILIRQLQIEHHTDESHINIMGIHLNSL